MAHGAPAASHQHAPGQVVLADKSLLLVACGDGVALELVTVQPEGKRAMRGADWVMGRGVAEGDKLGS
jgi:methionyl-tRNA formyltransferase